MRIVAARSAPVNEPAAPLRAERAHIVPALDRMMDLLALLEREPAGQGLRELAARSGIARTTAYRLLNTLEAHRLVSREPDGTYRLGSRLVSLAAAVPQADAWRRLAAQAAPLLQALAAETAETARLSVLDGDAALCIAAGQGHGPSALAAIVGGRYPLHAGAASKILLAALDAPSRRRAAGAVLPRFTPHTVTDWAVLSRELARVRAQGWARDAEEYRLGIRAVGIRLPMPPAGPHAAVSLAFVGGAAEEREPALVAALRRGVAALWRAPG
jgi:DNA-binding IclR family transcriptional regulator